MKLIIVVVLVLALFWVTLVWVTNRLLDAQIDGVLKEEFPKIERAIGQKYFELGVNWGYLTLHNSTGNVTTAESLNRQAWEAYQQSKAK